MISKSDPALDYFDVTPSDSTDLTVDGATRVARGLIIGTGGTLKVTNIAGVARTITVPAGLFPGYVKRVWSTTTTATGILALL